MQPSAHLARSSLSKADRNAIIIAAKKIGRKVGMHGKAQTNLQRILLKHFPDVRTVADARALGVDTWLDKKATMAVIKALFPNDKAAA